MISVDTTIDEMYRLGLISVRAMNVCRSGGIGNLRQLLKTGMYDLYRIRNCGRKTVVEINEIKERFKNYSQPESKNDTKEDSDNNEERNRIITQKKINCLSPNSIVHLKSWITWKYNKLSARAKNAFPQFSQLSSLIEILYSPFPFNAISVKNIGKKTCGEIQFYLQEVKEYLELITSEIDTEKDSPEYDECDKVAAEMRELYPFLVMKECEDIARYICDYKTTPILFIAKQFIFRSNDRRMNIYREYYGFNSLEVRYSITQIAERNNLSRERIRQLINKSIPLPQSIEGIIKKYLSPLLEDVISFDSEFWNKIQSDNMLKGPYSQTALLVCAVTDTHTIIQIDNNDIEYLVRRDLIENVKIKNTFSDIIRRFKLRRTTIERLDILQSLKSEDVKYHKDVCRLCVLYANYLKKKYKVVVEGNRYVMMPPNALDISFAIEDILSQSGEPMSLEEIMRVFNSLYPDRSTRDESKLKPYILKNPNIIAKGKTGIYVLKSWTHHFTGTLTSYLVHVLRTFNEPLSLNDLVDFALEEFPKSNKKSIYSLITGDLDKRFVIYENDIIGLADNPISKFELRERKILKRYKFETRFEELIQFVKSRKRFPIQVGSEEECSLARWIINILKSNIDSTEDQKESLNKFISEHKFLPQNGTEYNFKLMCDEVKVIVTTSFALPDSTNNIREYNWFHKNLEKFRTYEDNRRLYFEDLLGYLRDFGFYL